MSQRFISHNRYQIPILASSMNVGSLINYSPDLIVKIYKIGFSNILLKGVNANTYFPKVYYAKEVKTFENSIPSDIYAFEMGDKINGNIVHGSGNMPVFANIEDGIPASSKFLFRRFYYQGRQSATYAITNNSFGENLTLNESYQLVYEQNNSNTQPITLRQNEGIFILNDFFTQTSGYLENFIEFTIE